MYRVAHAGQTGYHQRAEMNKQIIKIGINPQEVQEKGGFIRYGVMKNTYLLVKGSLGGAKTRMIILTHARLPDKNAAKDAPKITYISTESKQ
jgi:large subunit ribosomal protein L3